MSNEAWISGPLSPETRVLLEADGWVCREMAPGWWEARPRAEWEAMDLDEFRDLTALAEMRRVGAATQATGRVVVVSLPPGEDWLGDARPESVRIAARSAAAEWLALPEHERAEVLSLLRLGDIPAHMAAARALEALGSEGAP